MTTIINASKFAKGIGTFAKSNALFMDTAWEAAESAPKQVLKADGKLTKAAIAHVQSFRELLMDGASAEDRKDEGWKPDMSKARDVWNASGAGSDSSYRGYVTHMANALVGIWVSGDEAEHMTFNALCTAGKAATAKPKGKPEGDGEDTMAALLKQAEQLMKRAPRKDPSKWDKDAIQFLGEFITALCPSE